MIAETCAFFLLALGLAAGIGAGLSSDPGGARLCLDSFLLGGLSLFLPVSIIGRESRRLGAFAALFVGYWCALAALGLAPVWRAAAAPQLALEAAAGALLLLAAAPTLAALARSACPSRAASAGLSALVCAFLGPSSLWGSLFANPSVFKRVPTGTVHVDTFFHSEIVNSIRRFGKVSLGLDGLAPVKTHFFSHALFAGFCKLTGAAPVEAYSLFYPIVFPALFLFGATLTFRRLAPKARPPFELAALFIATLATGLLSRPILDAFATWDPLLSESNGVALALLLPGVAGLIDEAVGERRLDARHAVCVALWILVLGLCKISIGAAAAGAVFMAAVDRRRVPLIVGLALGGAALAACGPMILDSQGARIRTLEFIKEYSEHGADDASLWYFIHWLPFWAGAAALALRLGAKSAARAAAQDAYARWFLVPAFGLALVGLNLKIFLGSGVYFTSLVTYLSLPWTTAAFFDADGALSQKTWALAAACLILGLSDQWIPRVRAMQRLKRGRAIPAAEGPVADDFNALLQTRTKLSSPACGLKISPDWLDDSALARSMACWRVPFQFAGILERPLYGSLASVECRRGDYGRWYHHPQQDSSSSDVCAQAASDGLSCVEVLSKAGLERIECRKPVAP